VEEYVRLKTASVVLRKAIERYRERNQGPVLDRAGYLFSQLTRGSFSGLRVEGVHPRRYPFSTRCRLRRKLYSSHTINTSSTWLKELLKRQ
jgi:hypothetical protein